MSNNSSNSINIFQGVDDKDSLKKDKHKESNFNEDEKKDSKNLFDDIFDSLDKNENEKINNQFKELYGLLEENVNDDDNKYFDNENKERKVNSFRINTLFIFIKIYNFILNQIKKYSQIFKIFINNFF